MDFCFPRRRGLDDFFVGSVATLTLVFVIVVVLVVGLGFAEDSPASCWSATGGVFEFEPDARLADRVRLETAVKAKDSRCCWSALFSRRIGGIFALSSLLLSFLHFLFFFFLPSAGVGGTRRLSRNNGGSRNTGGP